MRELLGKVFKKSKSVKWRSYPLDDRLGELAGTPELVAIHLIWVERLDQHGPHANFFLLLLLCPGISANEAHLRVVIVIVVGAILPVMSIRCRACTTDRCPRPPAGYRGRPCAPVGAGRVALGLATALLLLRPCRPAHLAAAHMAHGIDGRRSCKR